MSCVFLSLTAHTTLAQAIPRAEPTTLASFHSCTSTRPTCLPSPRNHLLTAVPAALDAAAGHRLLLQGPLHPSHPPSLPHLQLCDSSSCMLAALGPGYCSRARCTSGLPQHPGLPPPSLISPLTCSCEGSFETVSTCSEDFVRDWSDQTNG